MAGFPVLLVELRGGCRKPGALLRHWSRWILSSRSRRWAFSYVGTPAVWRASAHWRPLGEQAWKKGASTLRAEAP